jgi:exopolyphosphatase/guanosine-5'-triphosphate,3'-diphosphate pyrophosphatase
VRVAVIDVGSNSVRLLLASVKRSGQVRELGRDRVYLRLGDDAYRLGHIGHAKLDELSDVADRFARRARAADAERIETIVTAPGRQTANAEELVEVLEDATRSPVVVLTAEDEGRLAWEGAVAALDAAAGSIAVVDLGGGSCEVAIGTPGTGPAWIRSRDAGALRVTHELLPAERPTEADVARARIALRRLLDGIEAPRPNLALAVGGTARALAKVIGPRFGPRKLDALADRIAAEGATAVTAGLDITPGRIQTLLGGTLVLSGVSSRLESKLDVGGGGLREGAALALSRVQSAAA